MRILIVGGGVAGLTLAAKVRAQGREPVVLERQDAYGEHGYSLALYPFGSCVLHGLGAYDALREVSVVMERYELADRVGRIVQDLDMAQVTDQLGPTLVTTHAALVGVLRDACDGVPIRMGTTIGAVEDTGREVRVTLSDGSIESFDVVCGCDGIHSAVRTLVLGEQPTFETGWTGWTWWGPEGLFPDRVVREHWGAGTFFGVYPVPGRTTYVAAVPDDRTAQGDPLPVLREAFAELAAAAPAVGRALETPHDLFAWPLGDVRADPWSVGRVVLCGDAGTAFLPTAGVGASSAMRSAAALAEELSRADAQLVPLALELYAKRAQKVIRGNQEDSRKLARAMFVSNRMAAWGRDEILRHYPVTRIVGQIVDAMHAPV